MAIQINDVAGNVAKVTELGAMRVSPYPMGMGVGLGGSFRWAQATGTIGAGLTASSAIMAVRWAPLTNPSRLFVLHRLRITGLYSLTGFAAGPASFFAFRRTGLSSNPTGGTSYSALWATTAQKMRSSMANSEFTAASTSGDVRLATTGALTITGGTEDTDPFARFTTQFPATANVNLGPATGVIDLYAWQPGEHPLTLVTNDAIIVRATVPATGTWVAAFEMAWAEVETL